MKIPVTRKHIKNGAPQDSFSCPIALACKEHFDTENVEVNEGTVRVDATYYNLYRGSRFINRYDNSLSVKPFTAEIIKLR